MTSTATLSAEAPPDRVTARRVYRHRLPVGLMKWVNAHHVQTMLAYELNDKPLPVNNGAPLRARIERQLDRKHAKYLMRIELVESFDKIRGGQGGYWEDNGYEWYAGI